MTRFAPLPRKALARILGFALLASPFVPPAFGSGVTVRLVAESDGTAGGRWTRSIAEEWAKKTGNKLVYISRPNDPSTALEQYQQYWAAKSADVDVYLVDVIWQGIAAPHAVDLKKYYQEDELAAYFPLIIENNTVNGRLVSIPVYIDTGLLFYRTDLLAKYGYDAPPKSWGELEAMAGKIQDGERAAGSKDFYGLVFQGRASESLTCNAFEWIYSYGGGTIVGPDKKVTINNPNAIRALDTARSWVGTISPVGVTTYGEEEARNVWQAGNACFMRNWPYAYALAADPKSPVSGKFEVTVLPKGGSDGHHVACLGGWQLMLSAYSKVPDAAVDLIRYLSSAEIQKKRTILWSVLPTRSALYDDPEVLAKCPWFTIVADVLNNVVARPSTITGVDYNQLSTAVFQHVNRVLTGGESAESAVLQIEKVGKRVVH